MAIKEIKREWSPCQLDYVKTFLLHSEKDVKDLPKCCVGSKATVSETDNEYYCTADGWKLGSELGGGSTAPSEVVILPETEIAAITESPITTAPSAVPEVGAVCAVTYNGTAYDCPALSIPAGLDMTGVILGNSDAMGIPGGNAAAPFVIMFFDTPIDVEGVPVYGMLIPTEEFAEGTYVTLSIVQVGEASGGGSGSGSAASLIVNISMADMVIDKPYAAVLSALNAGDPVQFRAQNNGLTAVFTLSYFSTERIALVLCNHDTAMAFTGYVITPDGKVGIA